MFSGCGVTKEGLGELFVRIARKGGGGGGGGGGGAGGAPYCKEGGWGRSIL